jgi:hypothetical protein
MSQVGGLQQNSLLVKEQGLQTEANMLFNVQSKSTIHSNTIVRAYEKNEDLINETLKHETQIGFLQTIETIYSKSKDSLVT